MEAQEATAQIGSYRLFYRQAGSEGPVVVLMHGIPTNSSLWRGVIPILSPWCRIIAPDLLGYGRSSPAPVDELSLPRQAEHILALLDAIGVHQAHFVGHDLGGGIAQILAVHHPERVLSLVITDSVCFSNWPLGRVVAMRSPTAPEFEPSPSTVYNMLRIGAIRQDALTPEVIEGLIGPYRRPEGPEALQRAAWALEHHQTQDLVPHLAAIRAPATILWGQYDRFLPPYWGQRLNDAIPGSRFHLLRDCGHFSVLDDPMLFGEEVLQHLNWATKHQFDLSQPSVALTGQLPMEIPLGAP